MTHAVVIVLNIPVCRVCFGCWHL